MQNYPDAQPLQLPQLLSLLTRALLLFSCLSLFNLPLFAQVTQSDEKIDAKFENSNRTQILIGDPIKLKIGIQHPVGKSYQLSLDEAGLGFFELRGQPLVNTHAIDSQMATTTIEVLLVPFQTGKLPFPPLLLQRNDGKQLQTPALELQVEALTAPEERTIKDVRLMPETPNNGWLQATIIAVLLASGSLYLFLRLADPYATRWLLAFMGLLIKRKQPVASVPVGPRLSLEEEMIARLKLLIASDLAQTDVKSFHIQLAQIMSDYAIRRYLAPPQEYTTAELLELLTLRNVPTLVKTAFERILSACDLVKFARWQPDLEAAQRSARQAIDLLNALNHGAQVTSITPTTPDRQTKRAGGSD
jgi:hypothetical protein